MDWKRISVKKQEIDRSVKEEIMSHWLNMDKVESIPAIIRRFLPDQVDFFVLSCESECELSDDHRFALDQLSDCEDNPVHVIGTMDAMNSPEYRHLYDKNGWRTVVYILMNIIHEPIPNPTADDSRRLGFQVPGILISKNTRCVNGR